MISNEGNKLDRIFDKVEQMFEDLSERQDAQRDRIKDIEASNATMDNLRKIQDEMRNHVDDQRKKGKAEIMDLVDARLGSIRQGILSDTEKLLRDHLDQWMEQKMTPMVKSLIEAQEAKARAERAAALRMWRERAAFATAVIVLLWAVFNPFSNSDNAQESSRIGSAIESLNDITK